MHCNIFNSSRFPLLLQEGVCVLFKTNGHFFVLNIRKTNIFQ